MMRTRIARPQRDFAAGHSTDVTMVAIPVSPSRNIIPTETAYRNLRLTGGAAAPCSLLQLQRVLGNRSVARLLGATPGIQRQPVPATAADLRDFVQVTIDQFTNAAAFFPLAKLDGSRFERVINNWYSMVVDREKTIDGQLGGDPALKTALHTAYTAALRALMTRAASQLGKSEADLYRENRGRIPMWAWQTPHHMVAGISTPIAEGRVRNARTGRVTFKTNGFNVTILPDIVDSSLGTQGETRISINWGGISNSTSRRTGRITRVTAPGTPAIQIRTRLGPRAKPEGPSAYGRGTTPADIAGGSVTPASKSLRFHEGSHGLDFVEFLESHPPPKFNGAVGMTSAEFRTAVADFRAATTQYSNDINAFSTSNTDCVGTTIDTFNTAQTRPGQHIVLQCVP
jgi:hypothetical protein